MREALSCFQKNVGVVPALLLLYVYVYYRADEKLGYIKVVALLNCV